MKIKLLKKIFRCPGQVLVQVKSTSLNPLDKRMAEGYGQEVLTTLRKFESGKKNCSIVYFIKETGCPSVCNLFRNIPSTAGLIWISFLMETS